LDFFSLPSQCLVSLNLIFSFHKSNNLSLPKAFSHIQQQMQMLQMALRLQELRMTKRLDVKENANIAFAVKLCCGKIIIE
jgi:hypothetical protein